jgi:hypothetical protein
MKKKTPKAKKVVRYPNGIIKRDIFYGMTINEEQQVRDYMARNELSTAALFRKLCRDYVIKS